MSGKSCVLSMHAGSAVNDMQQRKALLTTNGATTAHASSGTTPTTTNTNASAAATPTALATTGNIYGSNITASKSSSHASTHCKGGKSPPSTRNRIGLPLPPPGIGIRHNIQVSSEIAAPSKGVPRIAAAVPDPSAAASQGRSGIRHNVQVSSEIAAPSKGLPRGTATVPVSSTSAPGRTGIRHNVQVSTEIATPSKGIPRGAAAAAPGRVIAQPRKGNDNTHAPTTDGSESDDDSMTSGSSNSSFDSDDTSDLDDSNSFCSSASAGPQHEQQMDIENETVSPDLEYAVIAHRKKGLILSRLSEVSHRGTLAVIDLARRGLGVNDVALIEQVILGNPKLLVLKLGYNDLGDVGAICISNAIFIEADGQLSHRALSVLDLCFNGIGDDGCGGLAMKAIAGNYHLRTLFLAGNNIRERGALSIAGALVHGCYLSRLHLAGNKIGPDGAKALATAVAEVDARVQMQEAAAAAAATVGGMPMQRPNRMEHLFLGSTSMLDGFYAIPSMLLSNTSLKVLSLTDNNIDDRAMSLLAQAFSQNKSIPLESINLSFNQITCAGVESLMNSIWGSPTLTEIKLDNNKMKDRGAQLCAVVLTSVKLQKLDVGFNNITTVGLRALMKSLSEDTNMRSLGICGIPIDLNAAKAVSFALAYNTGLETIYMDNCQVGYSAQRHISAGIVSNQRAPLKQLTGFAVGPIAVTLGMPQLPEEWSNEKVLAFVRLMWRNWGKKRGPSTNKDEEVKGPAPPAAVAAAAKIALASLGSNPGAELYVEPRGIEPYNHDLLNFEAHPLIPANAALIERTSSGRWQLPPAGDSEGDQNGFLESWTESSAFGRPTTVNYFVSGAPYHESPLDNPEQRNRNLRWLRTHFRPLIDVGQLPFNNADMWQLHQYYFSPPYYGDDADADTDKDSKPSGVDIEEKEIVHRDSTPPPTNKKCPKVKIAAPPSTPVSSTSPSPPNMGRAISFQALNNAVAAADLTNGTYKRRGLGEGPSAKRTKSLKPRIAYYPRIRAKLESLGTKPLEQTLSLLRKLKYVENVIFPEHVAYEELDKLRESEHATRLDVEMILLDLI